MKTVIFLIFLTFYSIIVFGQKIYYVQEKAYNTNASDMNIGTDLNYPWATWQKAFNTAQAGDTVYFRGGVWFPSTFVIYDGNRSGHNGTQAKPICYFNYPGETPIIDFSLYPYTSSVSGMDIRNVTYVKFKGLTFRNTLQKVTDQWISGLQVISCGNLWFENVTSYGHGGYGVLVIGFDTLHLLNCDSYNNFDNLDTDPGNTADGYAINNGGFDADTFRVVYMTGCRAWNNADDGVECDFPHQIQMSNNWSFCNGHDNGIGTGFKFRASMIKTTGKRKVYNNLSVYNKGPGFAESNQTYELYGPVAEYSNNTVYRCEMGFANSPVTFNCVTGFAKVIYRNNLVYHSQYSAYYDQTYLPICRIFPIYTSYSHNTWLPKNDSPYWQYNNTINWAYNNMESQFTSLPDSLTTLSLLSGPRKANGSLPGIGAFHLAAGSNLIDAGVDTGFPYNGSAPDLGAFEYSEVSGTNNEYPSVGISSPSQGSTLTNQNIIIKIQASDPDGSISRVELFYNDYIKIGEATQISNGLWGYSWVTAPFGNLSLRAVAFDNQGAKATSFSVIITVQQDFKNTDNSSVLYPNPNNGLFTFLLKTPKESSSDITIISFEGKIVYKDTMPAREIEKKFNLSKISSGFYILKFTNNKILHTSRFIKLQN